jgi:putative hydrolase of the HAD superfamily
MSIRAVLFDLGDTLVFTAQPPDPAHLAEMMARRIAPLLDGWTIEHDLDLPSFLRELQDVVDTAQPARRAQGFEVDAPFIARGAFEAHDIKITPAQAQAVWDATLLGFAARGAQAYPDTTDTLRRLRALGLPIAIVSNGKYRSDVWRPHAPEVGIPEGAVDVFVGSADLMRVKPNSAIFQRALTALDIDPRDALFVGDNLEADIKGAKALGMTTVWKLNGRHDAPDAPEANYRIHDLWELFTLGALPETTPAAAAQESLTPHEDANAGRY